MAKIEKIEEKQIGMKVEKILKEGMKAAVNDVKHEKLPVATLHALYLYDNL